MGAVRCGRVMKAIGLATREMQDWRWRVGQMGNPATASFQEVEMNKNPMGAAFSSCRTYRYYLWRIWDRKTARMVFIGLNPSTADEFNDDPTIRRCIGFAKEWGCGGLIMTNLFAFRATDPKEMKLAKDPIGMCNDQYLLDISSGESMTVLGWGNHGEFMDRGMRVIEMLLPHCPNLYHFGLTQKGNPRHPLYLSYDCQLQNL